MKGPAFLARLWNTMEVQVSKADQVPEFVVIGEMEDKLRRAMMSEWEEKATVAVERAIGDPPNELDAEYLTALPGQIISGFRGWPSKSLRQLTDDVVRETYELSAQAVARKESGVEGYQRALVRKADARFSTPDLEAMKYLSESQVFWLDNHWSVDVVEDIRAAAWLELMGQSGANAGAELRRRVEQRFGIGAFSHLSDLYFEGVAVNAATTARVSGSVLQMEALGIEKLVFVSVLDERTTEICQCMDGKEFSVSEAAERINSMVKSGDPRAVQSMHAWNPRGFKDVLSGVGVTVEPGVAINDTDASKIMDSGFALPPLHGRCRSTIDIA